MTPAPPLPAEVVGLHGRAARIQNPALYLLNALQKAAKGGCARDNRLRKPACLPGQLAGSSVHSYEEVTGSVKCVAMMKYE
jgi:hypothetical protein